MDAKKHRFSLGDIASFFIAGSAAIFAASLTLVTMQMDADMINGVLIVPLFPGLFAALLIVGGHGGTDLQETWALIVAPLVNGVLYAVAVLLIRLIWRHMTSKYALQPAGQNQKDTP